MLWRWETDSAVKQGQAVPSEVSKTPAQCWWIQPAAGKQTPATSHTALEICLQARQASPEKKISCLRWCMVTGTNWELPSSPEFRFARSQCLSCPKSLSEQPSPVGITLYWIWSQNLEWNWLSSLYSVSLGCGSGPKGLKQNAVVEQQERDEVSVPWVKADRPYRNTAPAFWVNL